MFIREVRTKNKKTGEVYTKHNLVESARVSGLPRQRLVMGLGHINLPRSEWRKLAHALECQLSGQISMLEVQDKYIEELALSLVSNIRLSEKLKIKRESSSEDLVVVDMRSISTTQTRSIGPELATQNAWNLLEFDRMFRRCGFSPVDIALSKAIIFGRLISPGSERATIDWFRKRSALSEFPGIDVSELGKDRFYEIGDMIYEQKECLERILIDRQQALFPPQDFTVYLYDITNTYMEGSALGNDLAEYGHCKSKRYDCPLVTLSLVVRNDGMPMFSHIYKGNQSEPETLEDMIKRLETLLGYDPDQERLDKPTIIMDRGIATDDNIKFLKSKSYQYAVIKRADQAEEFRAIFEDERESFIRVTDPKVSAYGDTNNVYVKKLNGEDGEELSRVLCISEGKARKQDAIVGKKELCFLDDISKLNASIQKGSIKNTGKIDARVEKIRRRHRQIAAKHEITITKDGSRVTGITATKKTDLPKALSGYYVIETTHTELDDLQIWKLYMTQTHVEAAFRSMKSDLGVRPIFHQTADRTSAHLFIAVLAYHLLFAIEHTLELHGDMRLWQTIREALSTHTRSTVVMKDTKGNIIHHRVSGLPEDIHRDIYKKLDATDPTKAITSIINTECSDR